MSFEDNYEILIVIIAQLHESAKPCFQVYSIVGILIRQKHNLKTNITAQYSISRQLDMTKE